MTPRFGIGLGIIVLLLAGCAAGPRAPAPGAAPEIAVPPAGAGDRAARRALELVGTPYRYGGNGPDAFDCSGLVRFVFAELGVSLPRTSEAQYAAGEPVAPGALAAGDLVFFRIPQAHIGIFLGDGRFVHAPASGRAVSVARLDEPWFSRGFVGAARVAPAAGGQTPLVPSGATVESAAAGVPSAAVVETTVTRDPRSAAPVATPQVTGVVAP